MPFEPSSTFEVSEWLTAQYIFCQLLLIWSIFADFEDFLDLIFEGKVEGLLGEIADDRGKIPPPER